MTITAILCVHDDLTWLPEALSSIASQTRPVQEILVVKSVQTPPEADALAEKFNTKTTTQPTPGLAAARNHGIALAQGELLAFLDSDDLWEPEKTQVQLAFLTEKKLDAVTGTLCRFAEAMGGAGQYDPAHFTQTAPALTPGGLLVKKSVFETVGLFDTRYRIACDHEWFMRLTEAPVRWEKTSDLVLRKRIHTGNLSNRIAEYRREIMEILKQRTT
jgi:glycosyltransferase involved in cell wall biosynthesis